MPSPLPPRLCHLEYCKQEGRCFRAYTGQAHCVAREVVQLQPEDTVKRSIGHAPHPDRPGYNMTRPPMEHRLEVTEAVFDPIRRKVKPFIVVPHHNDYREKDSLAISVSRREGALTCWRMITHIERNHDALAEGWMILGLHSQ